MTDPTAIDHAPVNVNPSVAPVAISATTRALLIGGFAALADHYMKSETAIIAVLACSGAVVTALASVWSRVQNLKLLRYFAHMLPDEVATVSKPA